MPVVGIDCRFGSAFGGLGTYTRNLVTALAARPDPWSLVLFADREREEWLSPLSSRPNVSVVEAAFPHYSLAEQMEFPNLIQDVRPDLLLFPHFNVPLSLTVPFVCTVHDLILHRYPNQAGLLRKLAYRFVLRQALSRAVAISTVSAFTRSDIADVYGSAYDRKTTVIHPGIGSSFYRRSEEEQRAARARHRLEQPFLLYVGNCKPHKNVPVLLEAFARAGLAGVELVLVTGGRETAGLRRQEGVHVIGDVPEEELPALMSASLGCVTASLLEGFCLPLPEAMACRVPALGTFAGSIPEATGGFALLTEPTPAALAEGLRALVLDPARRTAKALDAAEAFTREFTWERSAAATASLLRKHLPSD